jgi:hypothetical protein
VSQRKSLSNQPAAPASGLPPTRRAGARHEVSARVSFRRASGEISGWALNVSRGGVRAILEERVELGDEFDITIGDSALERPGRVVWTQDEPDGSIVGVSFLDDLAHPPWPGMVAASARPPGDGSGSDGG